MVKESGEPITGANALRLPRNHRDPAARICWEKLPARPSQTGPDTGFVPGIKGAPVQIRLSRPLLSRSERVSDPGPGSLFDLREPDGEPPGLVFLRDGW